MRLNLRIRQLREEDSRKHEEDISQLKACKEILHIFASIIERQDDTFSILGVSLSETAIKAIIGITVSTTVAVMARIGLDLSEAE